MLARLAVLISLAVWPSAAAAQADPRPPCGGEPVPAYAPPGAPPNVAILRKPAAHQWSFPACSGFRPGAFRLAVAVSGSFRHAGEAGELLQRFGTVSALRQIRYWSVSDARWRPLIDDAAALGGPDAKLRRRDFARTELAVGSAVYFEQAESRLSTPVIYRMRILEFGADRLAVEIENASAIGIAVIDIAPPGSTRAVHYFARREPGVWGYYGLAFAAQEPGLFLRVRDASLVNRAVAYFRHFAGIPTDREPPAAR